MSKLVLYGENGSTKEYALERERMKIGRRAHNDIHLDGPAVSGDHAVIITLAGDSFLEDRDSTNGTFVNQKMVQKCVLHDGDEIKIAGFKLVYVREDEQPDARPPAAPAGMEAAPAELGARAEPVTVLAPADGATVLPDLNEFRPSVTLGGVQGKTGTFTTMSSHPPKAGTVGVIRIVAGPGVGQSLRLTRPVSLGKPGVQVAAITQREGRYYLGLVEGDELPLVNGKPASSLPYVLQHKDMVNVAGVEMSFTLE